jgi:V8-like Glu-specific endopeptidase
LENNPGFTFGLTGIAPADVVSGDLLCIMGHPEGAPKRVASGPASRLGTVRIEYDSIDTRGGNSGSGILADAHGLIVGVHTNGGCCEELPGKSCPHVAQPGANKGVRISALLKASPILKSLASGGGTPTA